MKIRTITLCAILALGGSPSYASDRVALGADIATGWGNGRVWLKSPNAGFKRHGYKIVSAKDGHPVRLGSRSIKFEVRPGDCGKSGSWDDCKNDRERHEFSQKGNTQKHGDEYWFAWSIYIPENTPMIYPTKVHLGQFHQRKNNVLFLTSWNNWGYMVDNQVPGDGSTKETKLIVEEGNFLGRWVDVLIHSKWSHNNDGFYRVFVDRKMTYEHVGQTIAKGDQSNFKFGLYRSFISRYMKAEGAENVPKQFLYYDEVHRSKTLSRADKVGIAELQKILARMSLYTGKIDGLWGRGTRAGTNVLLSKLGKPQVQDYSLEIWSALGGLGR